MSKRILVTGGAGFIGYHLCNTLLKQGHIVISLDNFSTGQQANIDDLKLDHGTNFASYKHDIIMPFEAHVEEIYHLACPASPIHYQPDPIQTMKTNVIGAINVLELARITGAKIFFSSTSEVYGDPLEHPQKESYWGNVNPNGPRSCYDEGKRAAETLFFDYNRIHDVNVKVGRIFNTYGSHMDPHDGRVVSNFIVQALMGDSITIYGDGSQTRSFCYVDDLVNGFLKFMNDSPDDFHGPVNLGNPVEFTVKSLAEKVIEMTNSKSNIVYMPLPTDDPTRRNPDITRAKEKFGWHPVVNLEDGLKETINYFQKFVENC